MSDIKKELDKKPAEVVARQLVTWIRDKGLERTLEILGGDSTASNTGWRAGCEVRTPAKVCGSQEDWRDSALQVVDNRKHLPGLVDQETWVGGGAVHQVGDNCDLLGICLRPYVLPDKGEALLAGGALSCAA